MIRRVYICSCFTEKDEGLLFKKVKRNNFAIANVLYERKLINGFEENDYSYKFISTPCIGTFPKYLKSPRIYVKSSNRNIECCDYNSFFGLQHIHQRKALIKKIKELYCKKMVREDTYFVYITEVYLPFIEAAIYFKKMCDENNIKCHLIAIVPDLPQNIQFSKNILYKLYKKFAIKRIYKKMNIFENFIFFTKPMSLYFNSKKFIIEPGIQNLNYKPELIHKNESKQRKWIVYAGNLSEMNGVNILLRISKYLTTTFNCEVHICGQGKLQKTIEDACKENYLIKYYGLLNFAESLELQRKADVIIALRDPAWQNSETCFPSKIFESLSIGKPVVAFRLPPFTKEMDNFMFYPKSKHDDDVINAIKRALEDKNYEERTNHQICFLEQYLPKKVVQRFIHFEKVIVEGSKNES